MFQRFWSPPTLLGGKASFSAAATIPVCGGGGHIQEQLVWHVENGGNAVIRNDPTQNCFKRWLAHNRTHTLQASSTIPIQQPTIPEISIMYGINDLNANASGGMRLK